LAFGEDEISGLSRGETLGTRKRSQRGAAPRTKSSKAFAYKRRLPVKSEKRNSTRKTTKQILAIVAAVPATTPKPRTPAKIAIMRNMSA